MATKYFASEGPFDEGVGVRSLSLAKGHYDGTHVGLVTTGNVFTITSSNVTPVQASVGGRPCINITNSGSGATDGVNWTGVAASIIAQPGKRHIVGFSYYSAVQTDTDVLFGLGVVGTTLFASDPTNHVMVRKLAAASSFSVRARKSSGTAETYTLPNTTLTAAHWWDFQLVFTPSSTAGLGRVQVYAGVDLTAGQAIPLVFDNNIATQSPDTVALAPIFAVRAGSSANITHYVGHYAYSVEA